MAGPDPAVAAVRRAVRTSLHDLADGALVLAAVSGGADSLALLAGLAWEAPRHALRAGAVHVDHGLRADSADVAEQVAKQAAGLGVDCRVVTVTVDGATETAARAARYAALDACDAATVLLGHTRDDQAEQVLLGLARGSGARSLAGMPAERGRYRRPLLDLPRATTEAACRALGLVPHDDPANDDRRFTRNRVRHDVLPVLERHLGPGIADALARTAGLLRADADALDALAEQHATADVAGLAALPAAIRTRVLRAAAIAAGAPPTDLTAAHVAAIDALVTDWHGQQSVSLPGGLAAVRRYGTLGFTPAPEETP